jgi:hypothetical protein
MANPVTVPNLPAITKADSKLGEALKKLQENANSNVTDVRVGVGGPVPQVIPSPTRPFDPTGSH